MRHAPMWQPHVGPAARVASLTKSRKIPTRIRFHVLIVFKVVALYLNPSSSCAIFMCCRQSARVVSAACLGEAATGDYGIAGFSVGGQRRVTWRRGHRGCRVVGCSTGGQRRVTWRRGHRGLRDCRASARVVKGPQDCRVARWPPECEHARARNGWVTGGGLVAGGCWQSLHIASAGRGG